MNSMQDYANTHYSDSLPILHAQLSALGFYQEVGWIAIGEVFLEENIEHRTMIRIPSNLSELEALRCWREPGLEKVAFDFLAERRKRVASVSV